MVRIIIEKKGMILPVDIKNIWENSTFFMVRTLRKLGIEENFFNLIKKSMKNLKLMYNIIIDYKSIILLIINQ